MLSEAAKYADRKIKDKPDKNLEKIRKILKMNVRSLIDNSHDFKITF